MTKLDPNVVNLLGQELGIENSPGADDSWANGGAKRAWAKYEAGWRPRHGKTQRLAFENRRAKYILLDGERGSGKTEVGLDMLVNHCFLHKNALGFIIVRETGMSKEGGAWDKLVNWVLPKWETGNKHPETGKHYDSGIGLYYTAPRLEYDSKKPYLWIGNRFGSGSRVTCFSLPVDAHVEDKIKGKEASFILLDEAQTCESDSYFSHLVQQVGRRQGGIEHQPVVYCANPDGPSHWLYKRFFQIPVEDGVWNDDYARFHVPISENLDNLPPGYYDRVIEGCRTDPVMMARYVRGEWVDYARGQGIFKDVFSPMLHIRPYPVQMGVGLMPVSGHTIIAGYDLGPAHSSIHFMQMIPVAGKVMWLVFDELNFVGQYVPYQKLVPKIMARMDYWDKMGGPFRWEHVSDNSAFNNLNTDGSYDVMEVEKLSDGRIKLREAPKGKESVAARCRMLMEMFAQEEIIISATCTKTLESINNITRDASKNGMQPRDGDPLKHPLDSMTYPMFYYHAKPNFKESTTNVGRVIYAGQGRPKVRA